MSRRTLGDMSMADRSRIRRGTEVSAMRERFLLLSDMACLTTGGDGLVALEE